MPCRKTFGFMRFDRPALVRGGFQGPGFDVCGVRWPPRCSRVGVPCWVCVCTCFCVHVRVLVFVCFGFASQECGRGNRRTKCARIVCSLQVVVEKKVERCKGSVELSNSRARRVNKTEDLFLRDRYLIPCKPYPKGLPFRIIMPCHITVGYRIPIGYRINMRSHVSACCPCRSTDGRR